MFRRLAPWLAAASLTACGGGDGADSRADADPGDPALTYYADVKPLVDRACANCHVDGGIAPFPLTNYAEVSAYAGIAQLAMTARTMPPWQANDDCNDYHGSRALTDAQIANFAAWVEAGTLEGDPASEPPPLPDDTPTLTRIDKSLAMPEPYRPSQSPDDYRCFLLPWPAEYDETMYVTGFGATPGNATIVHHIIAFVATPEMVAEYEQKDAAEPGPGYTCFGGTGGPARSWLGAWAPGGLGADLPEGTGLAMEPGSMIILQVHYNMLSDNGKPDTSAIELKLDAEVDKVARLQPFTNPAWTAGNGMLIPAGEADASHSFAADIARLFGPDGYDIHSAALHMHNLGAKATLSVERTTGESDCVLDIPAWDFDWQGSYGLVAPMAVGPGDELRIECHWDNSAANQPMVDGAPLPPRDVTWGEGTTDEMCLGVLLVTAR